MLLRVTDPHGEIAFKYDHTGEVKKLDLDFHAVVDTDGKSSFGHFVYQYRLVKATGDGQFSFVVDEFSCGARQLQAGALTREAQGTFCLLRFTVTNASNSPALFLSRFQYLLDGQRTYGPDDRLTAALPENGNRSLTDLNFNPGISVPVVLVFDVPDGLNPVEARLRGNGRSRLGVNVRLQRRAG